MEHLSQTEWKQATSTDAQSIIIDVRTEEEFNMGMIEHAINLDILDIENFMREIESLDREKSYYLYCQAGGRSSSACRLMDEMGFKHTFNLIGGVVCWKEELMVKA